MHCRRAGSFWSKSQIYAYQLVKREISNCLSWLVYLCRSWRFEGSRRHCVRIRIVNCHRYSQVRRFWWVQIRWRDQELLRTQENVLSVKLNSIWLRKIWWRRNHQRKHIWTRISWLMVEPKEIWSKPNNACSLGSSRWLWWSDWARRLKCLQTKRCRYSARLNRRGLGLGSHDI